MTESHSVQSTREDDIQYDSFVRSDTEQDINEGTAQLIEYVNGTDVDGVDPSDDIHVFKIEKTISEETGTLVVEEGDWRIIKAWTGTTDVSELAGKFLPIKNTNNDLYEVHSFAEIRGELSLTYDNVKYLYDNNCIKYEDGQWVMTGEWKEHNEFVDGLQGILSFVGFISAFTSMMFLVSTSSMLLYTILLSVWMVILGIQMRLSSAKSKPLKIILDNI